METVPLCVRLAQWKEGNSIKQLVIQLEKLCRKERVVFVSGTGKRKTPLQRYVEQAREYMQERKKAACQRDKEI